MEDEIKNKIVELLKESREVLTLDDVVEGLNEEIGYSIPKGKVKEVLDGLSYRGECNILRVSRGKYKYEDILEDLQFYKTELEYNKAILSDYGHIFIMKDTWIVTGLGNDLLGNHLYIIEPLEVIGGKEGFTGLWIHVLSREDLVKYFKLKESVG